MGSVSPEYNKLHYNIRRTFGSAREHACEHCGEPAREWAHIHDTDPQNITNYMSLCIPCHRRYDRSGKPGNATGSKHTEEHKKSLLGNTRGQATWFKKKEER